MTLNGQMFSLITSAPVIVPELIFGLPKTWKFASELVEKLATSPKSRIPKDKDG